MKIMNRKNRNSGFSLVEAIVGLGLMTTVGLGVMQLQSNQVKNQKTIDIDYEAKVLVSAIYDQLKNKDACAVTFGTRFFNAPFNFTEVRDPSGGIAFRAPQDYKGQTNIRLLRFIAEPSTFTQSENPQFREGSVRVAFEYQKASSVLNNQTNYKKYIPLPIRVRTDNTGKFSSCITASDEAIVTSVKKFCESLNGVYNVATERCDLDQNAPDTTLTGISTSTTGQAISSSGLGLGLWQNIFTNRYVNKNDGGTITGLVVAERNVTLNQPPVTSMDAINKSFLDSRMRCQSGQVGFMAEGGVRCDTPVCNNPLEYLVGVNSNGQKVCLPLVTTSESCAEGGRLRVEPNGSVGFECCTPSCTNTASRCIGETFTSANNCGLCQGTAPTSVEGTWSSWTDTGETRQTSACVNNFIQMEKKQKRTCTVPSGLLLCQSFSCSGSDERWEPTVAQSCGAPAGKCVGYGTDTSNMFISGAADTGSCSGTYRYQYFDIVVSQFKVGNIYSITRGQTVSDEVKPGDTPQTFLQRLANKINSAGISATGACGTSNNYATVTSANRIQHRVQWQHSAAISASRSCNGLTQSACTSTPNCNWDTTSANVCTGGNYVVKQGVCNGTYYRQACAWNGMGSGSNEQCRYGYPTQSSCNSASSQGCYWGSVAESCYASSQSACSALGAGCSWKSYPDDYRSCTATSWESGCTGVDGGAGVCTWGPR